MKIKRILAVLICALTASALYASGEGQTGEDFAPFSTTLLHFSPPLTLLYTTFKNSSIGFSEFSHIVYI